MFLSATLPEFLALFKVFLGRYDINWLEISSGKNSLTYSEMLFA